MISSLFMECGILGLPNVGKSTLFNALTASATAEAANYPFCTIEPNKGTIAVPDERLGVLMERTGALTCIPAHVTFVDIAGLVKGAHQGEGLGNKFLSHVRSVHALLHVVRCFSGDVIHVSGSVNPRDDMDVIETELLLADLHSVETRLHRKRKHPDVMEPLLEKAYAVLAQGKPASAMTVTPQEEPLIAQLQLLTQKPMIYVCNVDEEKVNNVWVDQVREHAARHGRAVLCVSHQWEAELSQMHEKDRKEFLMHTQSGLEKVIQCTYYTLQKITFFTAGPKEVRAWTVHVGATAYDAAGVIHTDFQRGFIRAEVLSYADYVEYGSMIRAKEEGKMRVEGKDYLVQDGDIMLFRFNV